MPKLVRGTHTTRGHRVHVRLQYSIIDIWRPKLAIKAKHGMFQYFAEPFVPISSDIWRRRFGEFATDSRKVMLDC